MRSGEIVVESAVKWLGGVQEAPFFCWVHLFDPHAPYEGHAERFGEQFAANPYDGDIAFVDLQVEALRKQLEEAGVDDDTLIIIAGDHGEGFGEHDELEHGFLLYNSTLRVPLIVSSPRAQQPGHREAAPVSLVDVLPSVLDCLEIPATGRFGGASFKPALDGQPIEPRTCYSETVAAFAAYGWAPLKSITTADWKYIETTRSELYDLHSDPGELQNVLTAQPEQSAAMQRLLADVQSQMVEAPVSDVALTDAERRALESLGYVHGKASPAAAGETLRDVKDEIGAYNAEIAARKQLSKGQADLAIAALQKLVVDHPSYMPGRLTLGAAFQSQNRLDEAQATYEEALRVDPHSHNAQFDLAQLLTGRRCCD
ncbi:MAG: sulfatase-like hydrolase/transferase [Planctomycetaceae bacterium]